AIELDQNYAWVIENRGEIYEEMGKYEEALADFNRVIELDPENTEIIKKCGTTYCLMGKFEEALADFNRAIELDPENAETIEYRGDTFRAIGKYEEALAEYHKAIKLDSASTGTHLGLIACYRKLDMTDEYQRQVETSRPLFLEENDFVRASFAAIVGGIE